MKNFEKYSGELIATKGDICDFVQKRIYKTDCSLCTRSCQQCRDELFQWLNEEYKPQIDWSKVPVDTPVIDPFGGKRHFCKYNDDQVFTFDDGTTSWSCPNPTSLTWTTSWLPKDVQLARPEDIEKYSI